MIGEWVCDKCYNKMDVYMEHSNRYLIHCPHCGEEWFVDANGEYINEDRTEEDDDFKLADFCRGGDLTEDC